MMKIVFFGSDDFAGAFLENLSKEGFEIAACVTQPDKPQGRGLKVIFSPIKEFALNKKIPLLQPEKLKGNAEFFAALKKFNADLFVVIAYGQILPLEILSIPKIFCVNVHGSLLPKYRGAAPINWAVINGEKETGLTIMKLNPQMDAGEMIAQMKIAIAQDDTSQVIRERMMQGGPAILVETLKNIEKNKFTLTAQDEKIVSFAPKLTKDLGKIDWTKKSSEIHNLIRGLLPRPGAFTIFAKKMVKILESEVSDFDKSGRTGEIIQINQFGIIIKCGQGALLIKKVHPESSKPMGAADFVHGSQLKEGIVLGTN